MVLAVPSRHTLLPLDVFIPCLTITRVSRISLNILDNKLLRNVCLAYIRPLGETVCASVH